MEKKWYKSVWFWIIVLIILSIVIAVPFIINWSYLKGTANGRINTAFSASDMLTFYGSILGGLITLFGITVTIIHFSTQQKSEMENIETQRKIDIATMKAQRDIEKNRESFQNICANLNRSIYILDVIDLNHIYVDFKNLAPTVEKIQRHVSEIHRIIAIDMIYKPEQREILSNATEQLKKYATEYSELVSAWADECSKMEEYFLYQNALKLLSDLQQYPEAFADQINNQKNILSTMKSTDFAAIIKSMATARNQMVEYYNNHFVDLQIAVKQGIEQLEQYYENIIVPVEG